MSGARADNRGDTDTAVFTAEELALLHTAVCEQRRNVRDAMWRAVGFAYSNGGDRQSCVQAGAIGRIKFADLDALAEKIAGMQP